MKYLHLKVTPYGTSTPEQMLETAPVAVRKLQGKALSIMVLDVELLTQSDVEETINFLKSIKPSFPQ